MAKQGNSQAKSPQPQPKDNLARRAAMDIKKKIMGKLGKKQ